MAQVSIHVAGIEVGIEDEDAGFKPVSRKARALVLDLIQTLRELEVPLEDDDE